MGRLRNIPAFRWGFACRRACLTLALVTVVVAADAATAVARDDVFLVGNSFSGGLRPRLRALMRSAGRDVSVSARAVLGWTLAHHANSQSTLGKIRSRDWNAVVLQEQSSGIFEERYPSARALDAEINGRTIFFMTWRNEDEDIEWYDYLLGEPGGSVGYVPIAFELDASIAPVGWVFREILLHEESPELWASDGHHASERGRYIAALVLFTTICGESPVGLWFPRSLDPDQVLADQLLVEQVVLGNAAAWNIDVELARSTGLEAP